MNVETERLTQRPLTEEDAPFILELLNDPDWIRYIGDRGVRTLEQARAYLVKGPIAMYAKSGFGLYVVVRKHDGASLGMCGLIKRDTLDDVDLGFAFLPQYRSQGYAYESALPWLEHAWTRIGLARVVAIVSPENASSRRLLERLGLAFERSLRLAGDDTEVALYAAHAPAAR